ncbi:MAG: hypothetical protein JNL96_17610 [Planctomycetaceae bacterium]|nr:hypothetical protein [Planctomycetaceae bacterium]MBN8626138.1 hypothetical protein [Planctomycetota bacterium]
MTPSNKNPPPPETSDNDFPEDDQYVLARLAIWAGDLNYAIETLDQLLDDRGYRRDRYPDNRGDLIGMAASRLRRQASRMRNTILKGAGVDMRQFRRIEGKRRKRLLEIGYDPKISKILPIELPHDPQVAKVLPPVLQDDNWFVRGTVWQEDTRRFRLLIYLSDLKLETDFYQVADKMRANAGATNGHLVQQVDYTVDSKTWEKDVLNNAKTVADYSVDVVVEGNPFIEGWVSDFGTIEAEVIWTKTALPVNRQEFLSALRVLPAKFLRPQITMGF